MTLEALWRGDWPAVVAEHDPAGADPAAWLRLAIARWQQGETGNEALERALKLGAEASDARAAAFTAAQLSLGQALLLAGLDEQGLALLQKVLPEWVPSAELGERARLLACKSCAEGEPWKALHAEACESLVAGDWQRAQAKASEWVAARPWQVPQGVDPNIWTELLLNSCSTREQRLPGWWLVESRSLPRSGHHFLKQLLQHAWGRDFSYCESYHELGCCNASPCSVMAYLHFAREHRRTHLRLLKSHDFSLSDATFAPPAGMVRLIQVRRPFDLLVSWLELQQLVLNRALLKNHSIVLERIFLYHEAEVLEEAWRLIDDAGTVMSAEQAQEWLAEKVGYVVGFLRKWLPLARPFSRDQQLQEGNVLLRYEDLGRCHQLLKALGRHDLDKANLPEFAPRRRQMLKRRAARVTKLMEANHILLKQADAEVMTAVPAMAELYPASGEAVIREDSPGDRVSSG